MNTTPDPATTLPVGRIHYDGYGIRVTDTYVDLEDCRYPVGELHDLRMLHTQLNDLALNAGLITAALLVVIARVADRLDSNGWIGAAAVLAIPLLLTIFGVLVKRREYVLLADYRGMTVVLGVMDRSYRFQQLARAIGRAQENAQRR